MDLNAYWLASEAKLATFTLRERLLILLVGLTLIGALATFGWLDDAKRDFNHTYELINVAQNELALVETQNREKQAQLARDPNQAVREQLDVVVAELTTLDSALKAQTIDLIPAYEMPQILETLLGYSTGLQMQGLDSLTPVSLMGKDDPYTLYKHGIKLQMVGNYFAIYNYLKELEGLSRQFYWQRLSYRVTSYPLAEVEMEIYTLSTSKGFIRG